jgi:hypothetical protein
MRIVIATSLCAWIAGAALFVAADDKKAPPPATATYKFVDDDPAWATQKTAKAPLPAPPADPTASPNRGVVNLPPNAKMKVAPKEVHMKSGRGDVAILSDQPHAVAAPPQRATNDDVEGALEKPTFADFSETPLSQLTQFLATQGNIRIHIDEAGLSEAMVDRDQAVTFKMSGVRLALVLDLILEPLNLDYAVRENVLFISSKNRVAAMRDTAVVRVGDLVAGASPEAATRLVAAITENIDRDEWNASGNGGGGGSSIQYIPEARSLVVTSNSRTQRKITRLLSELRNAKVAQGIPVNSTAPIAAN